MNIEDLEYVIIMRQKIHGINKPRLCFHEITVSHNLNHRGSKEILAVSNVVEENYFAHLDNAR